MICMAIVHYQVPLSEDDMAALKKATLKDTNKDALTEAVKYTIRCLGAKQ